MKSYQILILLALFSCKKASETKKTEKETETQCFIVSEGINFDENSKKYVPPTNEDILKNLPKHIQYQVIEDKGNFESDLEFSNKEVEKEKRYFSSKEYKDQYAEYLKYLPEFQYLARQNQFAIAKNKYGLWLIELERNKTVKPYFLGLNQNTFIDYNYYAPAYQFIESGNVVLDGTLVNVTRLSSVPVLPKYEVIKDDLIFTIRISDIKKDSDNDGFNDLFENFIGLNPNSKDTDGDGISDFEDSNPKFKSEASKFTAMYEAIADETSEKLKYSFTEILTDCEYFQNINPKNRKVLIYNTTEEIPLKKDVLDNFFPRKYSKMKTYKDYPDVYFMDFSDESGDGTISAEFKDGKWKVDKKYTMTFGV